MMGKYEDISTNLKDKCDVSVVLVLVLEMICAPLFLAQFGQWT